MGTGRQTGFSRSAPAAGAAGLLVLGLTACEPEPTRRAFGEPVDTASARRLAVVLADLPTSAGRGKTVVAGTVAEVCTTAGCWFSLQDVDEGKVHELLVDLEGGATFTVPRSIRGRRAIVQGEIVGEFPDLKLRADGVVVE